MFFWICIHYEVPGKGRVVPNFEQWDFKNRLLFWRMDNISRPYQITIAGAGDGIAEATSHSWNESPSIGRFCGSVFASTLFKTLSSAASPLLEADFASDPSQAQQSLQPENHNSVQTLAYNTFCEFVSLCGAHARTASRDFGVPKTSISVPRTIAGNIPGQGELASVNRFQRAMERTDIYPI